MSRWRPVAPSRWRPVAASLVVGSLVAVVALGGCGVPTSSEVQYVGPGPATGLQSLDRGSPPPLPDAASAAAQLVEYFLQAPAGNPDSALERARRFIRESDADRWRPDGQIRVVRLLEDPVVTDFESGSEVDLRVQPIGILNQSGYLDAVTGEPTTYEFRVVTEGSGPGGDVSAEEPRFRLAEPPPELLLADTALTNQEYYYPTPIYFWDSDEHQQLVPDLRWLPTAGEPTDQHPLMVLRWLLAGPAPSLARLRGLPPGTQPIGTPGWHDENRLVVNLNAAAQGEWGIDDLATQLAWSLLPLRPGAQLDLRIDDEPQVFTLRGPSWERGEPVRLAVLDGVIRQFEGGELADLPVLAGTANSGVLAGAVTRDGRLAAIVKADEAAGGERLSVVQARDGDDPAEAPTDLTGDEVEQPTWVRDGESAVGLAVADGHLYRFTAGGGSARVTVPGLAEITAVAVAPERRRLALVADGKLHIAMLQLDGDAVVIESPRVIPTTLDSLAEVAFSHENRLLVAGEERGRVGLYALTVDGGWQRLLRELGNPTIASLVARPLEDRNELAADAMYEADGQAYMFGGAPRAVPATDLFEAPEDAEAVPQAPFFAD